VNPLKEINRKGLKRGEESLMVEQGLKILDKEGHLLKNGSLFSL